MAMREMQNPSSGSARRPERFSSTGEWIAQGDYRRRLAFALAVQAARFARRARHMARLNPEAAALLKIESERLKADAESVLPRLASALPAQSMARAFLFPAFTAFLTLMNAVTFAGENGIAAASPVWLVSHNAGSVTASKQSAPANSFSTGFRVVAANAIPASVPVEPQVAGAGLLSVPPARVFVCSGQSSSGEEPRFAALSMIETGNNDLIIGSAGEVSRYQITPAVWKQYCALDPVKAGVNPFTAGNVAQAIMQDRCSAFANRFHRAPSDFEFYLLWNRPAVLLSGRHLSRAESERARRFANLCSTHNQL